MHIIGYHILTACVYLSFANTINVNSFLCNKSDFVSLYICTIFQYIIVCNMTIYNMFLVHVNVCDFVDTMLIVVQINLI